MKMNIPIYYDLLLRISTSSMKVVLPTTQEPGVGAKKYKIQFPVCSTWITQVPPPPPRANANFLLHPLCALLESPRYPPSPILTHWDSVTGANWVPVAGANWVPGVGVQKYKFLLSKQSLNSLIRHLCALP